MRVVGCADPTWDFLSEAQQHDVAPQEKSTAGIAGLRIFLRSIALDDANPRIIIATVGSCKQTAL